MNPYPAYKESGVPWLGEVPEHWRVMPGKRVFVTRKCKNVGNLEKNILSLTLKGVIRNSAERPIGLSPSDYATYQIFEKDDLVFKLIDLNNISTSRVGLVPERGIMSSAYVRLSARSDCNIRYFYFQYYDLWLRNVFNGLGSGVRQTLSANDLLDINILVPPPAEQSNIVAYLDAKCAQIDALVARRQGIIEKLRELKQEIIAQTVTKGLNPRVPMKDSGISWLGKVPEHWEISRLRKYMVEIKERNSPVRTTKILSLTNKTGVIPYEEKGNQGNKAKENYEEYKLAYPKTLVMNSMNVLIGSVGICEYFGCVSPVYYVCKPTGDASLPYLNYIFQNVRFLKELRIYAKGIMETRMRLSSSDILKRNIPYPPPAEQTTIAAYLDEKCARIDELILRHERTVEKLKELRVATIVEVVTGKVDVRKKTKQQIT